ncbi:hypothetical protein [Tsuneonella sp. HG222]
MAETQEATVGYMGEFHLHNGTTLYELVEVVQFKIPDPGGREQVDKTHLKSPDWRREHISTFYEDSDFDVVMHTRLLSTTATLLDAAQAADDVRAFMAVIPEDGEPAVDIEGTCRCINVNRGEVVADGVIQTTATFRIVTLDPPVAHS